MRIITALVGLALIGLLTISTPRPAFAGSLTSIPQGQGAGVTQKDATTGVGVVQQYQRPIRWVSATAKALTTILTNSSQALTLTAAAIGASANYNGPVYLAVCNTGVADLAVQFSTAVTALTVVIPVVNVKAGTSQILPPTSVGSSYFAHLIGLTATVGSSDVVFGILE